MKPDVVIMWLVSSAMCELAKIDLDLVWMARELLVGCSYTFLASGIMVMSKEDILLFMCLVDI